MSTKGRTNKNTKNQVETDEEQVTSRNYNDNEKNLIRQLVEKYKDVVENKRTDAISNSKKLLAWKKIEEAFNAQGISKRTHNSLKRCWEKMKKNTKNDYDRVRSSVFGTGGGPPAEGVSHQSRLIHDIIAPQVDPLNNAFDNDAESNTNIGAEENHDSINDPSTSGGAVVVFVAERHEEDANNGDTHPDPAADDQFQQEWSELEDHEQSTPRGKKRRKCNYAQEKLLGLEKIEHGRRLILVNEKIVQQCKEHSLKQEILQLKKKYWKEKLNEADGADEAD